MRNPVLRPSSFMIAARFVRDARNAGPEFPKHNLSPRNLVLNLGQDCWLAFDTDLLRVAAIWNEGAWTAMPGGVARTSAFALALEHRLQSESPSPDLQPRLRLRECDLIVAHLGNQRARELGAPGVVLEHEDRVAEVRVPRDALGVLPRGVAPAADRLVRSVVPAPDEVEVGADPVLIDETAEAEDVVLGDVRPLRGAQLGERVAGPEDEDRVGASASPCRVLRQEAVHAPGGQALPRDMRPHGGPAEISPRPVLPEHARVEPDEVHQGARGIWQCRPRHRADGGPSRHQAPRTAAASRASDRPVSTSRASSSGVALST